MVAKAKTKKPEWSVTTYPGDRAGTFKIIAVSPDRNRVIHADRLSQSEVDKFDPAAEWAKTLRHTA